MIDTLNMSCDDFIKFVRDAQRTGEVKISIPLSDFDLAVYWAIGVIGDRKGYPCDISLEEIYRELPEKYKKEECR